MEITNCSVRDMNEILSLYDSARTLQSQKNMVVWPLFDKSFIEQEIEEHRQWKIIVDNSIACNWVITFSDENIWEEKEKGDAIYIHRIATNPNFKGNKYIDKIVEWAKEYAFQKGKRFVRLDTLGNNLKLIEHYTSAGFQFLGIFKLTNVETLPDHYHNERNCCLFEISL